MGNPAATRAEQIAARLEALKLVKEWSSGLVVIQTAAIGVVGGLFKSVPIGPALYLLIALLASLTLSVCTGAVSVMGTIPYIVENLPGDPDKDIYDYWEAWAG